MSTAIKLQPPYSDLWRKGYLNTNSEGRKTLTLFNSHTDRSSTQYARYLMAVKLGRFLSDTEEVDHIDEDKSNDDLSNLRIISPLAHRQKNTVYLRGNCYVCGKEIIKAKGQLRPKAKHALLEAGLLTCSRKCGYIKTSETLRNKHE